MGMEKETNMPDALRFKPITSGLGLNHFSDGLPYAPSQQGTSKRKPMVPFNLPPPRVPKQAPVAETETIVEEARASVVEPAVLPDASNELQPAGFIRRIFAFGLDIVFSSSIFALIVWSGFRINGYDVRRLLVEQNEEANIFLPLALLYVVMHLGYFLVQETTWRRTLGKAIMGIHIRSTSGFATLGRAICFFVAAVPLGVGLIWYFFDAKHRCWHDVITDTEVVKYT
jgi:uncharacterized RDD family membrane protein YckC